MASIPTAVIITAALQGLPLIIEGAMGIANAIKAHTADIPDEERRAKIEALNASIQAAYAQSKELAAMIATDVKPSA